jgi:CrcB protein
MQLFWICLGGAAGTAARHLLTLWSHERFGSSFPYGTLAVNLIGCFLVSLVLQAAVSAEWSATLRLALVTGVLGGFTTYSAFNHETLRLFSQGSSGVAVGYIGLTVIGGLLSGWVGLAIGRGLFGR